MEKHQYAYYIRGVEISTS